MTDLIVPLLVLIAAFPKAVTDFFAAGDPGSGEVHLGIVVELPNGITGEYPIQLTVRNASSAAVGSANASIRLRGGRGNAAVTIAIPRFETWSPEHAVLYTAAARLLDFRGFEIARKEIRFGFRKLERRGNRFYFNSRPVFLRAFAGEFDSTANHGCFTEDVAYIRKRIAIAKRFGFNAERHHSHHPTETYLAIADELGLLQQIEIHGRMREGPDSPQFAETRRLWDDVVRLGRRHASVVIYSMGNEVYANEPKLIAAMDELYDTAHGLNPFVLVLNRSGSLPGNDAVGKYDLIERPIGEYEHSGRLAKEAFEAYLRGDRAGRAREFPVIAHEYPLASAFPRLERASPYPATPEWFKAARENAGRGGYLEQMNTFARNAERIQWRVIKQMIEAARLFPELSGYSVLRLHDTGAMVGGILDDFSNVKSVSADDFLQVNGPVALLADWPRETFYAGERVEIPLFLSNQTTEPVGRELEWSAGFASGKHNVQVDGFGTAKIGIASFEIPPASQPQRYTLRAQLGDVKNAWDFWAFPRVSNAAADFLIYDPSHRLTDVSKIFAHARRIDAVPARRNSLIVTDSWPDWMDGYLEDGGRLLLISDKNWREPEPMGNHGTHLGYFTARAPVTLPELDEPLTHWLTIPSNYQRRWGNSGTVVERHPALGAFPHDGFCDFQFFSLIRRAKSFWLDPLPVRPAPIIRAIDNFWRGNNKAYLVEFGVGRGRVLATTLNITQHVGRAPEADYLLQQFIRYAMSDQFHPATTMSAGALRSARRRFADELPDLTRRIGDVNASPDQYRYDPLSGAMN